MTRPAIRSTMTRKFVLQLIAGGLVGAASSYLLMHFVSERGIDTDNPSQALALGVALVLILLGLFVGLGAMAPEAGSKFLNVEDADELRDQRRQLSAGAAMCMFLGIALLALATAGGIFSATASAIIAAIALAATVVLAIASRRYSDELMIQLGRESSTLAVYLATLLAAGWAIAGQLDRAPPVTALGVFAGLCALQIGAIIWTVGRRGLLVAR